MNHLIANSGSEIGRVNKSLGNGFARGKLSSVLQKCLVTFAPDKFYFVRQDHPSLIPKSDPGV
jgi:hypothetical protein